MRALEWRNYKMLPGACIAAFWERGQPFPRAVCVGPVVHTAAGRAQMRRDIANFKAALKNVAVEEAFLPVGASMRGPRLSSTFWYSAGQNCFADQREAPQRPSVFLI